MLSNQLIKKIFHYCKIKKKTKTKKKFLFLNNRDNINLNIRAALLGIKNYKKFGHEVCVLLNDKKNSQPYSEKIYNELGITTKFRINIKDKTLDNFLRLLKTSLIFLNNFIIFIFKKKKFDWLIKKFRVYDIEIGDMIYDAYIRYNLKFINPSFLDKDFIKNFYTAIYKVVSLKEIIKENNIDFVVITTKGYISNSSIISRVATKLNKKVFLLTENYIKKYKNYNYTFYHYRKAFPDEVRISTKKVKEKLLENYISERFKGKNIGTYTAKWDLTHFKKINNNKDREFFKKIKFDSKKKVVLFCCNAFSDGPHISGKKIAFTDYYDSFVQTLKYINDNNNNFIWLFKPHPNASRYGERGLVEHLIKKNRKANVYICPDMNNAYLFNNCDYLITDASTSGLEFACLGKRPIIIGENAYRNKDFCQIINNKDEYFKIIKNFKFSSKLTKFQIITAKRTLFYLEMIQTKKIDLSNILIKDRYQEMDTKIYLTKLYDNFRKKGSLLNDKYIIAISNYFIKNIS